jgi:membrane peptidoglycan carboxypeptidase
MGQEIGVTPLQIVSAASTVANGGLWVRPRIVRQDSSGGTASPSAPGDVRRVIQPETAALMHQMMVQVVAVGTGKTARPQGYSAGGKTGTAQKLDPKTGRYSATDYIASFVGFAPAEAPLFSILVVLDSPRGRYHGGDVAAPVFRKIAEQVLAYWNIPSAQPQPLPVRKDLLRQAAFAAGKAADAAEPAESGFATDAESSGQVIVPNFIGQGIRAITAQALAHRLPVQVVGNGIAYEQSPPPGAFLPPGEKIVVRFRTGGLPLQEPRNSRPAILPVPARSPSPATRSAALPASG